MKQNWLFIILVLTSALITIHSVLADTFIPVPFKTNAEHLTGSRACSTRERWELTQELPVFSREAFEGFVNRKLSPVRSFSEALALRRFSQSNEARVFSEYWIARSLYEAKLIHIANDGFVAIASKEPTEDRFRVQFAALECLVQINQRYPSMGLNPTVAEKLDSYLQLARSPAEKEVVWQAAEIRLRDTLAKANTSAKDVEPIFSLLKESGPYDSLAKAFWYARQSHYPRAISELDKFLSNPSVPEPLARYIDTAHLLLARAYYSVGQFDKSVTQLQTIKKSSDDLAESLSELSWAYLMGERYNEAIGTAMSMQAGGLRHTFAPEAPMVMAMALNEICQYPQSVQAINQFRTLYEKPYRWLSTQHFSGLYTKAIHFIKGDKNNDIPDRVASEWVRSPVFIGNQDELNSLVDELEGTKNLTMAGAKEQRKLFNDIMKFAHDLKPKYKVALAQRKPGESLPGSILNDVSHLKSQVNHLRRLSKAAPVWRIIMANFKKKAPVREKQLVAEIDRELEGRSVRMLRQLDEIAENVQLIEVEIYNGASEDIIWQNAHPDYKTVAKKMKDDYKKSSNEKVWNWGRVESNNEENAEIWEDELGSFKADLFDNCESKDKYLALKRGLAGQASKNER